MKIKVKKEMRLDELIKWARENPELSKGKIFLAKVFSNGFVRFQRNTNTCSISSFIPIDTPFIVEVEEEITEDTVFDRLFEVYELQEGAFYITFSNVTELLSENDDIIEIVGNIFENEMLLEVMR
ncbi:TPA: hypothetical protein OV040_000720 [Staphylococcus aureus]|nr:hypothetical protein [Staphylococcus aureus]HAR5262371.1 hypothetical protein [Staphylococcus aureus]HCV2527582.1 hypothetical protein [Staphylococcus aureus]HCY7329872.1 hypothetical protein [Staphylococcus aureus]HDC7662947.1 hypothetical protein [Staphylococcus aureus]